mmetsp:Transcript_6097/g.10411  ORF Transcript_6097/g.10411 Transcript_6097/m.10411 type:complete len:815 (-) Transcript_6097:21-2465(-)
MKFLDLANGLIWTVPFIFSGIQSVHGLDPLDEAGYLYSGRELEGYTPTGTIADLEDKKWAVVKASNLVDNPLVVFDGPEQTTYTLHQTGIQGDNTTMWDQLVRGATTVLPTFKALVRKIADDNLCEPLFSNPELKSKNRSMEKIDNDYNGDRSRLTDMVRGSVVCSDPWKVMDSWQETDTVARVLRVKNRFASPVNGYRDFLLNIEVTPPQGAKYIVELQIHLKSMMDYKNKIGHKIYEDIRSGKLSPSEVAAKESEMKTAQDNIWNKALLLGRKIPLTPSQMTHQWNPVLGRDFDGNRNLCVTKDQNRLRSVEEDVGCRILAENYVSTYQLSTSMFSSPSGDGYNMKRTLFKPNATAMMLKDGCFQASMMPAYTKNYKYTFATYEEYKNEMSKNFNLNIGGEFEYKDFFSVQAKAEYTRKSSNMVVQTGIKQHAGGRYGKEIYFMSITNTCIKPCISGDGGKCTLKYLVEGAIKDLEAWQQDPGNIKLAEAFAALYGHIIPTKWLYGYSDIYDFSVEFKSGSTATASTVSHGLDAAIQASGWGAKGNANTKMNMEANYSAATQGSESSLSTSRIIQGPPECAEADVANCLELFLSDVRGMSPIKVDDRVSVATVLTPDFSTTTQMAKALARGSAPCTSVYTTDSGKAVFPGFKKQAANAYAILTRTVNNTKYVFQAGSARSALTAEWTEILNLPITNTFRIMYSFKQDNLILENVQGPLGTYLNSALNDFRVVRSSRWLEFDRAALENQNQLCSNKFGDNKMYCLSVGGRMVDSSIPPKYAAQEIAKVSVEYMNGFKLGIGRDAPVAIDVCTA